jgi:hypothetical protein
LFQSWGVCVCFEVWVLFLPVGQLFHCRIFLRVRGTDWKATVLPCLYWPKFSQVIFWLLLTYWGCTIGQIISFSCWLLKILQPPLRECKLVSYFHFFIWRLGGHAVAQWLRHCATNRKVTGTIPDGVTGIFHWQSFRLYYGPGVDSASNRNEYQEYFLGVKAVSA